MKTEYVYCHFVNHVLLTVCKSMFVAYGLVYKDLTKSDLANFKSYSQFTRLMKKEQIFHFNSSFLRDYTIRKMPLISTISLKKSDL